MMKKMSKLVLVSIVWIAIMLFLIGQSAAEKEPTCVQLTDCNNCPADYGWTCDEATLQCCT